MFKLIKLNKLPFNIMAHGLILAIVFILPIVVDFSFQTNNIFELPKAIVFRTLLYLLLLTYLAQLIVSRTKAIAGKWLWPLLIVIIFLLINIFISLAPSISWWGVYHRQQGIFNLLHYLLFFWLVIQQPYSRKQYRQLILTVILSSVVVCFYGLIQFFGLDPWQWSEPSLRIFSTLGQPNFFGYYLLLIIPLTIWSWCVMGQRLITKFGFVLLLVAQLWCLVLTASRGAWLGFLAGAVLWLLFWLYQRGSRKLLVTIFVCGLLIFSVIVGLAKSNVLQSTDNFYLARIQSVVDLKSPTVRMRLLYWRATADIWQQADWQQRLLGFGKDTQRNLFASHYQPQWGLLEKVNTLPDRAHNILLDYLLEFGLLGILIWLWFWGYYLHLGLKLSANKQIAKEQSWLLQALLIALFSSAMANMFGFPLVTHSVYHYLFLGLLVNLSLRPWPVLKTKQIIRQGTAWLLWLAILLFLIFCCFLFNWRFLLADYYYGQARRDISKGDCAGLLDHMNKMVASHPDPFYKEMYVDRTVNCLDKIPAVSDQLNLASNVIDQLEAMGDKSQIFYTKAVAARAYSLFGYFIHPQYYDEAVKLYEDLIVTSPYMYFVYQDYGRQQVWAGNYGTARQIYGQGLGVTPYLPPSFMDWYRSEAIDDYYYFYVLIGDSYTKEKNWVMAQRYYEQIFQQLPTYVPIYSKLAEATYNQGKKTEALDYLLRGYRLEPDNLEWGYKLALLYQEVGNMKQAKIYAEQVRQRQPDNVIMQAILDK
ncbi:MAG: O-antigen ligase family protein [bacterium]